MPETDPFEREVDAWMKRFAALEQSPRLPDPNSLWVKAKLMQSAAAAERASLPITRVQVAAYLVVASGWAALVTWKWNALSAWINSFTPTHIIMGAAGEMIPPGLAGLFHQKGAGCVVITAHHSAHRSL